MHWLDVVIAALISLFALFGVRSGLIRELFSVVAVVAGMAAGVIFHEIAAEAFVRYGLVGNRPIASVAGFIAVMFAVYAVVQLAGWAIGGIIGSLHLNWLNRLFGGIFGAIKGGAIAFLLISAIGFFYADNEPPLRGSALIPYLNRAYSVLRDAVPDNFTQRVQSARKLIQDKGIAAAAREAEKIKELMKDSKENPEEQ
ncbi:MAG: CvpA family protein [Deltaproteobacteria bacterium]